MEEQYLLQFGKREKLCFTAQNQPVVGTGKKKKLKMKKKRCHVFYCLYIQLT